jgi:NAD(P)-dependent dehydrogenase (short-subunit alcohol dehydrogenase family)
VSGRLADRHAVVTGGGRGIGRAIATAFSTEGAGVPVVGRTAGDLDETVRLVHDHGGSSWSLTCDIRDEGQVRSVVDAAMEQPFRGARTMPLADAYDLGLEPWTSVGNLEKSIADGRALNLAAGGTLTSHLTATVLHDNVDDRLDLHA